MKLFLIYQAEVAICLGAFYVFYKLLLSKDVSYQLKRGYIIFTGILAHLIPALTFNITLSSSTSSTPIGYFSQITEQLATIVVAPVGQPENIFSPWQLLLLIWGLGLTVMLIGLVVSLYNVNKIMREANPVPNHSFKITGAETLSFSFFKAIVLNPQHYHSPALKYILAHEQTHASQFHTVDILFIEMIKSLQWFNPFAWLFAKESALNLEYIADNEVISQYADIKEYQMAIVQLSQPTSSKLLRTEFSKSNLKNRINMMNQPTTTSRLNWRYILLLPVVLLLLTSFSLKIENLDLSKEFSDMLPLTVGVSEKILARIPLIEDLTGLGKEKNRLKKINKEKISASIRHTSSDIQNKEVLEKNTIETNDRLVSPITTAPEVTTSSIDQDTTRIIKGRIISKDGNPEPGVNVIIKGTSSGTVTNNEGEFALLVGNSYNELVIAAPNNRTEVIDISANDEFEITLTSDMQISSFPADGKNVKFMTLDSGLVLGSKNQPLFIHDGEEMPLEEVRLLNPNDIASLKILKGESATKLYGDKADNGVVIIELKRKRKKKKG
jgi:bla regulator protein blaR1